MNAMTPRPSTRRWGGWFNNRPLFFKISSLVMVIFALLLMANSLVILQIKRSETVNALREVTVRSNLQLAEHLNRTITSLVEEMILLNRKLSESAAYYPARSQERAIEINRYINDLNTRNNNYQYLHSILIMQKGQPGFIYRGSDWNLTSQNELPDLTTDEGPLTTHWTGVISDRRYFSPHNAVESSIVSFITPFFPSGNRENVTILNLSADQLAQYLQAKANDPSTCMLIDCGDGSFITSGEQTDLVLDNKDFINVLHQSYTAGGQGMYHEWLLASSPIPATGWQVTTLYDTSQVSLGPSSFFWVMSCALLGLFLLLTAVVYIVVGMITRPLRKLTAIMREVTEDERFDRRFRVRYADEIGILAQGFNRMMDRIVALSEQAARDEEEKRRAEIRLMQMQIKPHFLYNALETARFLSDLRDPRASEMITDIAQFYKLSLSGVADRVTLEEELEQLEYYLKIQRIRYASCFQYELSVDPQALCCEIVKFTLQPIVENAIYHGIKPKLSPGRICLSAWRQEERLMLTIWDDGVGMHTEQLQQLRDKMQLASPPMGEKIGVYNVNRRLMLCYGPAYGLRYESEPNCFTCCTITIPAVEKGEMPCTSC